MIVGTPDSRLNKWVADKEVIITTDEGEAVAIAAGRWFATHIVPTVFMSADGFCNALNPLTSLVIPYGAKMDWVIGVRTDCFQHIVMGNTIDNLIKLYGLKRTGSVKLIR